MKYATWKLDFTNPEYGIGPEGEIATQGFTASGAYIIGEPFGGTILGYFSGEPTSLEAWDFQELTEIQALEFVSAIDPTAFLQDDGTIATEAKNQGE
jgi:hypothetical protein